VIEDRTCSYPAHVVYQTLKVPLDTREFTLQNDAPLLMQQTILTHVKIKRLKNLVSAPKWFS